MERLDKEDLKKIKEDLAKKNMLDMHRDLMFQRRIRILVMSVLILALCVTIVYGTLENPLRYTLSNIGNFFTYRIFFIVWAIITGMAIQFSILALFKLENYDQRRKYWFVIFSVIFLILTAITPALKSKYPFWHMMHTIFAGLHALFLFLSFVPFTTYVAKENPRLYQVIYIWEGIIWGGGILSIVILGHSAIFELWFFITMIIFLLYLSLVLFEEKIVKMSVAFLKDEQNLNEAIEKVFIDLDKENPILLRDIIKESIGE